MKRFFPLLILLALASLSQAKERPERVPNPLFEQLIPKEQFALEVAWWNYLLENPKEEMGYIYLNWAQTFDRHFEVKASQYGLELPEDYPYPTQEGILHRLEENLPHSFARYFLAYRYHQDPINEPKDLLAAYAADPTNTAAWGHMATYYTVQQQLQKRRELNQQWYNRGEWSHRMLWLYANLLETVEEYGVLVVGSERELWGCWLLQDVLKHRTDVVVIGPNLLDHTEYRPQLLAQLGWNAPKNTVTAQKATAKQRLNTWMFHLKKTNPDLYYYIAINTITFGYTRTSQDAYPVGLAHLVTAIPPDNMSMLKHNLEDKYYLDYLRLPLEPVTESRLMNTLERDYSPGFSLLYKHYTQTGQMAKAKTWYRNYQQLAKRIGEENRLNAVIPRLMMVGEGGQLIEASTQESLPKIDYSLDLKALETSLVEISPGLYAQDHEVTMGEYFAYLRWLQAIGKDDLLKASIPNLEGTPPTFANLNWQTQLEEGHFPESLVNYPVVGITHEAANGYFVWMMMAVNESAEKPKIFEGSAPLFRLPTAEEWEEAALNLEEMRTEFDSSLILAKNLSLPSRKSPEYVLHYGQFQFRYPWWGYALPRPAQPYNERGGYLGNYLVSAEEAPECECDQVYYDGYAFLAPVKSYFKFHGLYDMSGNVAEMTLVDGYAKGGSWGHSPEESEVEKQQVYSVSDTRVGFRLFVDTRYKVGQ